MQQESNQRIVYLDLLRVIATFAVIQLHVAATEFQSSFYSMNWNIGIVYNSLVRWCVPVFVMISGALFLDQNREVTYQEILKKRVPRLLLAYVFWTVLYVLYGFVLTDFEGFTVKHFIKRSIVSPRVHLWFLPMLMGVYLLIPVLRKIAQDNKLMRYALIIWAVYMTVGFFQYVDGFKSVKHFYSLFNPNSIVVFSGYFLLGYFLSRQGSSKKQRIGLYLLGIVGVSVVIFGTYHASVSMGETVKRYMDKSSPQVIAMAVAIFVLLKEIGPKCGTLVLKFLGVVRKDLFGIYLTHMLWFPVVNTDAVRHCCSEWITLPAITIVVFLLSLFTTKLIRLVPVLRKVVE